MDPFPRDFIGQNNDKNEKLRVKDYGEIGKLEKEDDWRTWSHQFKVRTKQMSPTLKDAMDEGMRRRFDMTQEAVRDAAEVPRPIVRSFDEVQHEAKNFPAGQHLQHMERAKGVALSPPRQARPEREPNVYKNHKYPRAQCRTCQV